MNRKPSILTDLAARLNVLQSQMIHYGVAGGTSTIAGLRAYVADWAAELREIELRLRILPLSETWRKQPPKLPSIPSELRAARRHIDEALRPFEDAERAARQHAATPNATDSLGDLLPAAEWCEGPHPDGNACSECVGTIESHLAMKGAGLL